MMILTHRGLDPDRKPYFGESSREAFSDQLLRGYGVEFDVHITRDKRIVILHDRTLQRISNDSDVRDIRDVPLADILSLSTPGATLLTLEELCELLILHTQPGVWSALHLKHEHQNEDDVALIANTLKEVGLKKCIIFDTTPAVAQQIHQSIPQVPLFASVAHPFDIARYNDAVGGTLMSIETFESHGALYAGAWLDEWDLRDEHGGTKHLYTEDVVRRLKKSSFMTAIVSPELHATSPALLGGESHEDATDMTRLESRWRSIAEHAPDALCTDYPDRLRTLLTNV